MIPLIDITPLHGPEAPARRAADAELLAAATGSGFLTITADPSAGISVAARRHAPALHAPAGREA
jgi:isopenicillin N synthase-like dioxygenase